MGSKPFHPMNIALNLDPITFPTLIKKWEKKIQEYQETIQYCKKELEKGVHETLQIMPPVKKQITLYKTKLRRRRNLSFRLKTDEEKKKELNSRIFHVNFALLKRIIEDPLELFPEICEECGYLECVCYDQD